MSEPEEDLDDLGARRRAPRVPRRRQRLAPEPAPGGEAVIAALESERILANGKDPRRFAELYLDECRFHDDPIIARWGGSWWRYEIDMGAYRELSVEEFRADVWRVLDRVDVETADKEGNPIIARLVVKSNLVSNVVDALTSVAPLIIGDAPQWIRQDYRDAPIRNLVACANGLLDIRSRKLKPRTPRLFATASIGTVWRSEPQPCPEWLRFLDSLWGDDKESIQTLREMFGYLLTPDTSMQKVFALIGPPRCGKGTIARILTALLGGTRAVTNPMISTLSSDHGLAPLVGKTLAILGDARIGRQTDQAKIVELILSISGEDSVTINQKNKPLFTTRLTSRLLLLSNEVPSLYESSGALVSRFIMLRLTRTFLGEEDLGLEDKLRAELPGILQWAVDGWEMLQERGRFVQPASSAGLVSDMIATGSPIRKFIEECCVISLAATVRVQALYDQWVAWCKDNGQENHGNKARFGVALSAACPNVARTQPREGEARTPTYNGIGLLQK
jgi:putative DNA primase/helicase